MTIKKKLESQLDVIKTSFSGSTSETKINYVFLKITLSYRTSTERNMLNFNANKICRHFTMYIISLTLQTG